MSGKVPPFANTHSWRAKGQIKHHVFCYIYYSINYFP